MNFKRHKTIDPIGATDLSVLESAQVVTRLESIVDRLEGVYDQLIPILAEQVQRVQREREGSNVRGSKP